MKTLTTPPRLPLAGLLPLTLASVAWAQPSVIMLGLGASDMTASGTDVETFFTFWTSGGC
jgi:hypothetical protein